MSQRNYGRIVKDVFNSARSGRKGLIDKDDINCRNMYGVSALMMSVMQNNILALETLISAGADVNLTRNNSRYITALTIAVEKNRVECVKELVRAGAFFTCERGLEALKMARDQNFLDSVVEGDKVLNSTSHEQDELLSPTSHKNRNAFIIAYENECFDLLVDLINSGISTNIAKLKFEDFAREEVFNVLTNSPKIDINGHYWEGQTMLMKAVQTNAINIVKALIEKGANINHADLKGNTALHFAYGGKSEIISLLLASGAKVDVKNSENETPLHVAANTSDTEMMSILIDAKANINCLDNDKKTPLAICVENYLYNGNKNIVGLLIQAGADVNIAEAQCYYHGTPSLDKTILQEVKIFDQDSRVRMVTPLHIAARLTGNILRELHIRARKCGFVITPSCMPAELSLQNKSLKSFEIVNILLDAVADVKAKDGNGRTPLHIATIYGNFEVAKLFCQVGADINAVDKYGSTPLFLSLLYKHKELSKYLMESGADVNLMSESQCSPLHVAVLNNDTELVELLIKHGALFDNCGKSELLLSLKQKNSDVSIFLLENGANVNVKDDTQTPALIIGLKLMNLDKKEVSPYSYPRLIEPSLFLYGRKRTYCLDTDEDSTPTKVFVTDKESIKIKPLIVSMLQHGANVSLADQEGNACLHVAVELRNQDILELLIRYNADVNQQNIKGETPLIKACKNGYLDAAQLLLNAGPNVFLVDELGNTALHYIAKNRHELLPLTEAILSSNRGPCNQLKKDNTENYYDDTIKIDSKECAKSIETDAFTDSFINMKNNEGESALHIACELGHTEIAKLLILNNCDIDCTNTSGITPLMIATQHVSTYIAQILIEKKANINIRNTEGETALHFAVKNNNFHIVCTLLEQEANINEPNNAGQTPLFFAYNCKITEYLIEKGAEINLQDKSGETALHLMAKSKEYAVYILLEHGANPNISTHEGQTPLMYAANKVDLDLMKALVKHRADVNSLDCNGRNACMHAVMGVKGKSSSYLEYGEYFSVKGSLFKMIEVLALAGAKLNLLDNENRSLIVYIILNVENYIKKACIEEFLKYYVDPVIHENHRYLLNEFYLWERWKNNLDLCMHNILKDGSSLLFQLFLINGIALSHTANIFTYSCKSNIACATKNLKYNFVRFFLATGYIFKSDVKCLCRKLRFKDESHELAFAKREPWPLVKLAFIEVSTLLGTGPMREEKLKQTKLPPRLQRTLMFQEPISRLPVEDWSKIPLCFDPVQYETLPCPRPLLYYWPVGRKLVI
ncbi:ankyrin-1-like [Physella acuta]|uniref:ankyrin-1-like n=1 Tax=Physella acuta TaxID=109671 RepID=UPI0027DAC428|nr:ankyrin-1-like [Physella acuta]